MEEKQLNMPDEHPVPKKKRKGKAGRILLLLILILVAGAAIGYYFYERSQPAKELDKYLTGIQSLDFDTMESMLQSADLSALDNADVRNATYESFLDTVFFAVSDNRNALLSLHFDFLSGKSHQKVIYYNGKPDGCSRLAEMLHQLIVASALDQRFSCTIGISLENDSGIVMIFA